MSTEPLHTAYLKMVVTIAAGCANILFIGTSSSPFDGIVLDQQDAATYREAADILLARARANPNLAELKHFILDDDDTGFDPAQVRRRAVSAFLKTAQSADTLEGDEWMDSRLCILSEQSSRLLSAFKHNLP